MVVGAMNEVDLDSERSKKNEISFDALETPVKLWFSHYPYKSLNGIVTCATFARMLHATKLICF